MAAIYIIYENESWFTNYICVIYSFQVILGRQIYLLYFVDKLTNNSHINPRWPPFFIYEKM